MIKGLSTEQILKFPLKHVNIQTIYRSRISLGFQTIMSMKFSQNINHLNINKHIA